MLTHGTPHLSIVHDFHGKYFLFTKLCGFLLSQTMPLQFYFVDLSFSYTTMIYSKTKLNIVEPLYFV